MDKPGRLSTQTGRRSGGKCIDTWTFDYPEQSSVKVDVSLVAAHEGLSFHASSPHPSLKGRVWQGTDIDALRRHVLNDMTHIFEDISETKWAPALIVETSPVKRHGTADQFGVQMTVKQVHYDPMQAANNEGLRRIFEDGRIKTVTERSLQEERPEDMISGFRVESQTARSLIASTDEVSDRLAQIRLTLELFTNNLAARLGPNQIHSGLPDPADLAKMMDDASRQAAKK